MSKFNHLLEPLPCEWVCPSTGAVCEEAFDNMDCFISHVREQHLLPDQGPSPSHAHQETVGVCHWCDCQFKTVSSASKEFKVHVLFHTYHSYLKLLGKEYQVRQDLPDCQVDPDLANVLPLIEVDLKCQWDNCGAEFDCVSSLYEHVHRHVHVAGSDSTCKWQGCSHSCRDRSKLSDHTRVHTAERVVACPTCGSLFANNTKLKDHLNRQAAPSGDPNHTCSFCSKGFSNERLLREHTRRHVNTVQCPHCDLTCQSPSRLMEHIRYRHVGSRPHECPLCHKTFKTTHTLVDHLETHREKCYSCTVQDCFYMTKTARNFSHHMRSAHKGVELLYCCHICNTRFSLGRKLTKHLKDEHGFELPPGHCRFRYVAGLDGLKRLQTVRLDDESLITPELSIYQPSSQTPPHPPTPTAPPPSSTQQPTSSTATMSHDNPAANDVTMMSSLLGQQFSMNNNIMTLQ